MPITAKEMIKKLKKIGYEIVSQNGSHVKLKNKKTGKSIIIPFHSGDLKKGLEMEIRKRTGLRDD